MLQGVLDWCGVLFRKAFDSARTCRGHEATPAVVRALTGQTPDTVSKYRYTLSTRQTPLCLGTAPPLTPLPKAVARERWIKSTFGKEENDVALKVMSGGSCVCRPEDIVLST